MMLVATDAHYRNCPITEAIFEFGAGGTQLDEAARKSLVSDLRRTYSGEEETLEQSEFQLQGAQGGLEVSKVRGWPRFRLWSSDRRYMVQFGAELCAFNVLAPYAHFEDYTTQVRAFVDSYRAHARPTSMTFRGQRYINRIMVPAGLPGASWFVPAPRLDPEVPDRPFDLRVRAAELAEEGQVVVHLRCQGPKDENVSYTLDLYAHAPCPPGAPFDPDCAHAWQEVAHLAIVDAFEKALTPATKAHLGREER